MAIRGKTTESGRRHAFASFRERVDAIKIEPNKKLTKRAHDYVETSFFLTTLEHWRETNISGNFTDFLDKVERISQSLPQILHHKATIYAALEEHIKKNDPHSNQPLLELMAQFVHDLGPDFMEFYSRFLSMMATMAAETNPNDKQNARNSSSTLEWIFNCLAFTFKYLSKQLVRDLVPTFTALMPLLQLHKRAYLLRFCSEALSFLIRKLDDEALRAVLVFSFDDQADVIASNETYRESLTVLYAEAMKNTRGSFHSRATPILASMIENALHVRNEKNHADFISVTADVLLELVNHGSEEACGRFYGLVMEYLQKTLTQDKKEKNIDINHAKDNGSDAMSTSESVSYLAVVQLLTTLAFAESGKKVADWDVIVRMTIIALDKAAGSHNIEVRELLAMLLVTVLRNCDTHTLTKHHRALLERAAKRNDFLAVVEACYGTTNSKISSLGIERYVQQHINAATGAARKNVAYFMASMGRNSFYTMDPRPVVPAAMQKEIMKELREKVKEEKGSSKISRVSITHASDLIEIYWRLILLQDGVPEVISEATPYLTLLFDELTDEKFAYSSSFAHDVAAAAVGVLSRQQQDASLLTSLFSRLQAKFDVVRESPLLTSAMREVVVRGGDALATPIREAHETFTTQLCRSLLSPSHEMREQAIELMLAIHERAGHTISSLLSQVRVLEQIPLELSNGRDITLRVRKMASEFQAGTGVGPLERRAVPCFMFGMLTNRFQPCWTAVLDALPMLNRSRDLVFELAYDMMRVEETSEEYWPHTSIFSEDTQESGESTTSDESAAGESTLFEWQPRDTRVRTFHSTLEQNYFSPNRSLDSAIVQMSERARAATPYAAGIRQQAVQALARVPGAAEANANKLVPYVLAEERECKDGFIHLDCGSEPVTTVSWALKDRCDLVRVFALFKQLKRVPGATQLYEHVLEMLCHTQVSVQRTALAVVFNWGDAAVNRYRDNLTNLLDETIFRDELSKFVRRDEDLDIAEEDVADVMPLVLRILYGRVQGAPRAKTGRKFAVVSVLPSLSVSDVRGFLELGSRRINYEGFFEKEDEDMDVDSSDNVDSSAATASDDELRRISGFVSLLEQVYYTLGPQYTDALSQTIPPLVYGLVVAQSRIDAGDDDKTARTVRQNGMKCLGRLFQVLGAGFLWDSHMATIYNHLVKPRMAKFAVENLQQPSALMRMMVAWIALPNTTKFLYADDYAPASAVVSLLGAPQAKETVVSTVLEFAAHALEHAHEHVEDDGYFGLLAIVVDAVLSNLSRILANVADKDVGTLAVRVLMLLVSGNYIDQPETRSALLAALTAAVPKREIDLGDKARMLEALASLVAAHESDFAEIEPLYRTCSECLRVYADRNVRSALVEVFASIGAKFGELGVTAELVADLNAYNPKRLREYDFDRRLGAFRRINETLYATLTPTQWLPILYGALFFINDPEELAIRTNASYLLRRFIDGAVGKPAEDAAQFIDVFRSVVLPNVRGGLKKLNEDIQTEYIEVLEHAVRSARYFEDLNDMQVLTLGSDEDEEVGNFFANINHIQLVRRQRAVRNLVDSRHQLRPASISHYILPIIEHYAVSKEEKFNNIADQTLDTIAHLLRCVTWADFRSFLRRHISNLRSAKGDSIKKEVNMIVAVAKAFMVLAQNRREREKEESEGKEDEMEEEKEDKINGETAGNTIPSSSADVIVDLPDQESLDSFVLQDVFPPLLRILNVRDDDTIVARAPLSEALCCFITAILSDRISIELPAVLTNTCQVMRSRSEELRDAVRKSLCRILAVLGPAYLKFVLQELKSALSRGSQIHVLSFTVHYLLQYISSSLAAGDLDEPLPLIVDIIMEDIFGAAGQEKDAEGYHSKMKEVKFKKSFDTGEFVTANISLPCFGMLLHPVKLMLQESMSLKTQTKLDELMRRYALGLNHNAAAASPDILVLCYEIYKQALAANNVAARPQKTLSESEKHFMVTLDAKPLKVQTNSALYQEVMQKFAFDLLRTALSRHADLVTVANLAGFLPLLLESLKSANEAVVAAALKILNTVIRLPFPEDQDTIFSACTDVSLRIVNDSPTTHSELCQASLKFLATAIRHRPDIEIPPAAISYVLQRILPDLEEPQRQSLAFNFLKSVVSKHIVISDVYDVMDKVAAIMVTNGSKEIRDMSRSVYFQFLMEYEQGRGKLEKQFKFFVNNLSYPTESGRQSIMELIHLIITKAGPDLLLKLASSFFVALANLLATDDSVKCREMATSLLASIISRADKDSVANFEKYCSAWVVSANEPLKRCGLSVYKIYIGHFGYGHNKALDSTAMTTLRAIFDHTSKSDDTELDWGLLYAALNVFTAIASSIKDGVFAAPFESSWKRIIDTLLYPHAWVRLSTSRLVGMLLSNLDNTEFEVSEYEVQTIAYRLIRQLNAPSITEKLGNQIIKNLVVIAMRWEEAQTKYIVKENDDEQDAEDEVADEAADEMAADEEKTAASKPTYEFANDFLISRTCATIRAEHNYRFSFVSKKSAIKLAAMLIQVALQERAPYVAEKVLLAMYNITEANDAQNSKEEEELVNLTLECKQMLEKKLGVTEYTSVYSRVADIVEQRRHERKVKRSQMAITAPEIVAKRKLRKHERTKEKRKHERDENGFYRSKRKRFN